MISADEAPETVQGSLGYFAPMTKMLDSEKLAVFRKALETRLSKVVDPSSKAFFYGALSYDHILLVAHAIEAIKRDGRPVNRKSMMT